MSFSDYRAQSTLFAARPSRLALQQLESEVSGFNTLAVNVWRNHAIEPVISLALPYLAFGHYLVEFRLSDYDDTLMYSNRQPAAIELLWLDSSRYLDSFKFVDWIDWFVNRIKVLRAASTAPIIVATWLQDECQWELLREMTATVPAIYFADLGEVCKEAGVKLIDARSTAMAGTPISNAAQPLLARKLGCHWIPASASPPIKVVALDLDNTLHAGVLGEDGIQGVQLTPAHQTFQNFIKSLQLRGVFIALVSRNERVDVEALFEQRDDYPLGWDDFSATEISWGDKASAIDRIAKVLRVAPDSIMFVDDNPGELASVAAQIPQLHTVYASPDVSLTQRTIEYYPSLWRWKVEADDTGRVQDMKANARREKLLTEVRDPSDYFNFLQTTLIFRHDPFDQLSRLSDLCGKTNQFNMALRRFSQADIAERMGRSDACVASVQLKDCFSDSGVIAVIIAEREAERLVVEELCISCRAMGRQLEDTLILEAIRDMPLFEDCSKVTFRIQHGPRNQPAIDWLARLPHKDIPLISGHFEIPAEGLKGFVPPDGITLIKE